jgi:hypothetical protein
MINKMLNLFGSQPFGAFFQTQDAEWPHFVRAVGWEVFLRSDFPAKGVLHHGLEGGFPLGSQRFGRDQQVVRQIKRGFHDMGHNMGIWLKVKLRAFRQFAP